MSEVTTAVESFFTDIKDLVQVIAPIFAFLGMIGLGLMYMGSSWFVIGDWKGRP